MKNKAVRLMAALTVAACISTALAGCGQRVSQETETQKQTAADILKVTEKVTEETPVVTEKITEAETETQKLITSVDYTSKDGSIKITLPDNTWKVTQDADEMRVFKSADAATINITHASTPASMDALTYMTTEENLKKSLTEQYSDADAYDIKSFKTASTNGIDTYRYVVKYNTEARMWAYSVTYSIVAKDQAYVITGVVTDDNKTLLNAVQKSVESFRVLNDDTLKTVTSEVISGTTKKTSETVKVGTKTEDELKTLQKYGTTAKLVTNDIVNVRLKPGTDADVLTSLTRTASVDVVGETQNWFEVNILGNIGYIRKDFLIYPSAAQTQTETTASTSAETTPSNSGSASAELNTATNYGSSTTLYTTETVNLRSQPGTNSDVVNQLSGGQTVTVVGETDNWYIVSVGGSTAYISKPYLSSSAPETSASSNDGSTSGDNGSTSGNNNSGTTSSAPTYVGGTVTSASADTLTVAGDDGKTYVVYYGDANVNSADGIYSDVYVTISLDPTQAPGDGTYYATNVTGY